MAGELTAELLDEKLDVNGTSFQAASTAAGYGGASHQVWPRYTASAFQPFSQCLNALMPRPSQLQAIEVLVVVKQHLPLSTQGPLGCTGMSYLRFHLSGVMSRQHVHRRGSL